MQFCESYLTNFNATKSAIEAGYSEKTAYSIGYNLLKEKEVREYIQERMTQLVMGTDEFLVTLAKKARDENNPAIQMRALELIGRVKGLFIDRSDITSNGQSISLADYLNGIQKTVEENKKKKLGGVTILNEG